MTRPDAGVLLHENEARTAENNKTIDYFTELLTWTCKGKIGTQKINSCLKETVYKPA